METNKGSTDLGTLIGLLAGLGIIVMSIMQSGGKLIWFLNFNSLLIVVGGTLAATMVNLPITAMKNIFNIERDITIIIIAHRVTTLKFCEKIYQISHKSPPKLVSYESLKK